MSRTALRRVLGAAAVAGPIAFTVAWVVASTSSPRHHPWRADISALAAADAPRPWIIVIGELLLAAGILALAAGLAIALAGRDLAVAVGMLTVAALAVAVQATAREDCDTGLADCAARQQAGLVSWHHSLHGQASALSFLTILAAPVILARPLRGNPRWHRLGTYSAVTAAVGLAILIAYVATPDGWTGLTQRLFVSIPATWTAVLGTQLIATSGQTAVRTGGP
ncbi:DUF998 domain-containing protein [Dactylosporangium sp. NPDC049525]|uniref:DUF998 domain-containing protein n=1 Tax=Dactylosporangium sp. NPDC049525 TaxID=3154730 RepID=UPI003430E2B3